MSEPSFLELALTPAIRKRATRVALIVGTILALINHADTMMRLDMDVTTLLKICLTYLVPYCVATYSAVETLRERLREAGSV